MHWQQTGCIVQRGDSESDLDIIDILPAYLFDENALSTAKHFISSHSELTCPVFILENGKFSGYKYLKCLASGDESLSYGYTQFRRCRYLLNTSKQDMTPKNDPEFNFEVHGPALSATFHDEDEICLEFDAVIAFHCPFLPSDFDEWCNRKRVHGWPPPWITEATKKHGCLFVAVGHSTSDTQAIEWRLSLTKTENLLTKSFNHVQMKCYAMMKLVLKWVIKPQINESVSSYHVKTVMFWMSEERENYFWRPENLVDCFIFSLMKLKTFVENKNCPNYFLTDVNLLEGKIDAENRFKVLEVLERIIAEGHSVVYSCLPLNVQLNGASCRHRHQKSCTCLYKHLLTERIHERNFIDIVISNGLNTTVNEDLYRKCYVGLMDWHIVNEIQNQSVSDSDIFSAISICEQMGLSNKMMYTTQKGYVAKLRGNGYVARLKLATFLYYRRRLNYCIPLLSFVIKSMEASQEFELCTQGDQVTVTHPVNIEGIECIYLTQNNKGFRVSEIVFSPCDQHLIPSDLQNEMSRPKTVNGTHYEGWVFVDSMVYAYYLLIVTLHDMRRYSGITSWLKRFRIVCTQQPGAIRIFRRDMAKRLYEHAFMLVWAATKAFTKLSS